VAAPRFLTPPHRWRALAVALASFAAGALLVVAPAARADKPILVFPGNDASVLVRPDAGSGSVRIPPDPPPLKSRQQWVFDLRWSSGTPYLLGIHALDLGTPQETQRAMGRFALELFEGPTLIERVRFDFPMLGPPLSADAGGFNAPPNLQKKLTTRVGVMFPAVSRGTRLELWDRATDTRWPLPWPPPSPQPPEVASATDAAAGG
jgi:hypothetical protein